MVNRKEQTLPEHCLLLREIFENRPGELHSIGVSYCFFYSLSRTKNQLPWLNQWIREDLVTHSSVYLLLKAEFKEQEILSNKFNAGKWKNDNLFLFRFREKIVLII